MKHYLRFMLVLLLSTVWCVGGYSQKTVTFTAGTDKGSATTLTNGIITISTVSAKGDLSYDDNYRSYASGYIMITSNEGLIKKVVFTCTADNNKRYGPGNFKTTVGKYSYSGKKGTWQGSNAEIKFSSSAQVRMTSIAVTYESSKKSTTTTFGTGVDEHTFTITEGEPFPTHVATMTTEGVAGTIAYSSDNAAVNVDENGQTSAGTGFGKAKITATFTPTEAETYATSSAFYYIDYKEKTKPVTTISFEKSNIALTTVNYASFTGQKATLKAGETTLSDALTYSKQDADGVITTLNEDGTLVLSGKAGTATITAAFAGNTEYASSSESYTISVKKIYTIAELKGVLTTTEKEYSLNLKDAVVTGIYNNEDNAKNVNVYIEDESAGILIFYPNANNDFKVGQKLNGEVTIKGKTYNNLPEITSWTATESYSAVDGAELPLTTVTIAELAANFSKYESRRVKIENATVTKGTTGAKESGKIAQGESEMTLRTNAVAVTTTKNDVIDVIGYPTTFKTYKQFSVWSQDDVVVKSSVVKTTISFEPATTEYNVDNNNKDAFTAPTATVKDAEGNVVEGAAITYTSSKPSVATVGETDGKVTFVGFGTTVITASYAGDATHMASSSSYTINYGKVKTTMSWSAPTATANLGETSFDAPTLTLKAGDTDILAGKTIKYSSSATNVAEISAEGSVKIKAEGTTVITATFAGDDTYAEASASYTLTVKDPNKMEVTFDFMQPDKYGYGVTSGGPAYGEGEGDVPENATLTEGIVTLKNTTCSGSGTRFYIDGLRTYDSNAHTLYVPAGYRMTSISFNGASNYIIGDATPNSNWTGEARKVIIKYTDRNKYIKSLTVAYKKVELPPLTLNEDDNDIAILENEKTYANVTATRSMIADGGWYTFCVPFDIEDIATTPLKDAEIRKYKSMTGSIMNFEPTTSLKAMHAYLVKPTSNIVNPEFEDVFVISEGDNVIDGENGYKFVGIYSKYPLALDGTNLFLGADNTFYVPTPEDYTLKALRGYFVVPEGTSASKMGINIDGETTSISALNTADAISGKVYNLNGQYVGNNVKTLQKGIYVVNGKKIIVK